MYIWFPDHGVPVCLRDPDEKTIALYEAKQGNDEGELVRIGGSEIILERYSFHAENYERLETRE